MLQLQHKISFKTKNDDFLTAHIAFKNNKKHLPNVQCPFCCLICKWR